MTGVGTEFKAKLESGMALEVGRDSLTITEVISDTEAKINAGLLAATCFVVY